MPFNPDAEILRYCEQIMDAHIQTVRYNKDTGTWYWDCPAVAVICHDSGCNVKRSAYSHRPKKDEFHPVLERKLQELGPIGDKSLLPKRNVIGNCAEQHAGNIFMKQLNVTNLNDLHFSKSLRPRTKQVIEYCANCRYTFPNL